MFYRVTSSRFTVCLILLSIAFGIAYHHNRTPDPDWAIPLNPAEQQHIIHPDEVTAPDPFSFAEESVNSAPPAQQKTYETPSSVISVDESSARATPVLGSRPPEKYMFVFLLPPASFVYQQISLLLELSRRGHDVLAASLEGFSDILRRELDLDPFNHTRLRVMEFARVFESVSLVDLTEATQVAPEQRKKIEIKEAMCMYENMFQQVVEPLELALKADTRSGALIHETFRRSIFVFPGPWATPIKFCVRHGFKYVNVLTTPRIAKLFATPLYIDPDVNPGLPTKSNSAKNMALPARITRLYRHARTFRHPPFPIDLRMSLEHPTLKLVASIPQLTDITAHPPLTQFVGPLISPTRKSAAQFPDIVAKAFALGRPVIYISFGTHAHLSEKQVRLLAEAFFPGQESAWSVIWALHKTAQKYLPPDLARGEEVAIVQWIESPAVLSHPLTALFVSHCGANGLGETTVSGVPVLGLPLFGDQFDNCNAAERGLKLAVCRSIWSDSAARLRQDAKEILFNPEHPARTGADTARALTEKIYKGATLAADWLEAAAALRGEFEFTLTEVEKSGVVLAYNMDIMAALFIASILLAGVCGYYWSRMFQIWNSRPPSLKKVV